jgi:hypothetical protein
MVKSNPKLSPNSYSSSSSDNRNSWLGSPAINLPTILAAWNISAVCACATGTSRRIRTREAALHDTVESYRSRYSRRRVHAVRTKASLDNCGLHATRTRATRERPKNRVTEGGRRVVRPRDVTEGIPACGFSCATASLHICADGVARRGRRLRSSDDRTVLRAPRTPQPRRISNRDRFVADREKECLQINTRRHAEGPMDDAQVPAARPVSSGCLRGGILVPRSRPPSPW